LTASAEQNEIPMNLNGNPADLNVTVYDKTAEQWIKEISKRKVKMYDFVSLYPSQ
jgi:hypothetical protein